MRDLYQEVTDKILASLEAGVVPWVRPWNSAEPFGGSPYNAVSKKPYRGVNVPMLFAPQFASSGWMTFKQAIDLGANVRKGEHGSMIVFYKPFKVRDKNAMPDSDGNVREKTIPLLKCYHVFNVAQIENLPATYGETMPVHDPLPVDSLLAQATVVHGGDRAFYSPSQDLIRLPQVAQFRSTADYQATALHELTHWTKHESRLSRDFGRQRWGDEGYAQEELVAEMGAAFLCAQCGIDGKLQHPEYIANWLQRLKNDKRCVVVAAAHAQRAADFILRHDPVAVESEPEVATA